MRKTCKKLLALLLSFVLVLALAGCGGKTDDKSKDNDTTGNNNTTDTGSPSNDADEPGEEDATPTPVPEKFEAFDFGGKTIRIGTWWDIFYSSDHTAPEDDANVTNVETAQMKIDNIRRIEEKYNCRIVYDNKTWNGVMSSINTSIAAGTPDCEVYMADLQFGVPAIFNGLAQKLEDIAPANSDIFSEDHQILTPLNTESYGGTFLFQETQIHTPLLMGYNQTMIEDLGLEDPQELYANGEWTWEKFRELAKKGTKDTDNDGVTDVYGYGSVDTLTPQGFLMSNDAYLATARTEGLSSPATMETLEFLNTLYNVDYSARPFETDWNANWYSWASGKVMFWLGQPWLFGDRATAANDAGAPIAFEYRVVPLPKGPSKQDDTLKTPAASNWYFIPVGMPDGDKILTIMEEFFGWHNGDPELRDDTEWLEGMFLSQEDVDMAIVAGENYVLDPYAYLSPWFDFNTVFGPVIKDKSQTVAQAVEAAKGVLQTALDNFVYKNVQ